MSSPLAERPRIRYTGAVSSRFGGEGAALAYSHTKEEPRSYRRSNSRSGGRRVQQSAPRRGPKRRHSLAFKLYIVLVVLSALIVGVYIAHTLLVKPPEIAQPETPVTPVGDSSAQTTPTDPNALVRRDGVYNFVLLGKDVDSSNTDTIILVSFDTVEKKIGMISIPRDTAVDRDWTDETAKLNYAYHNGGADVLMEEIEYTFGVPVDYYIHVDLKGFIALVDELKGVDIEIPLDMNYDDPVQGLHIHFNAGYQHLDGQETMEAVRYRHDNESSPNYLSNQWYTDVQRGEFQRQVLITLAKKVVSWNSLTKVTAFLDIFNSYVETNLSLTDMAYFAEQALKLDLSTAIEQGSLTGRGDGVLQGYKWGSTTNYVYQAEDILPTLNSLVNPYTRDLTAEDLHLVVPTRYK